MQLLHKPSYHPLWAKLISDLDAAIISYLASQSLSSSCLLWTQQPILCLDTQSGPCHFFAKPCVPSEQKPWCSQMLKAPTRPGSWALPACCHLCFSLLPLSYFAPGTLSSCPPRTFQAHFWRTACILYSHYLDNSHFMYTHVAPLPLLSFYSNPITEGGLPRAPIH